MRVFLLLFFLTACGTDDITSDQTDRQRLIVEVERIERSAIQQTLELSGQLLPKNQVPLFTTMPLEVSEVHVNVGQSVERGDLLITLDDEEAERQVSQARSAQDELQRSLAQVKELNRSIESNAANMNELETELQQSINRSRTLINELDPTSFEGSIVELLQSSLDVSIRQAELLQAAGTASSYTPVNTLELELQISQAEEAVRQAESALQATKLTAPITGLVSQLDVAKGQTALPNMALVTVVDLKEMNATFSVNNFQVTKLQPGLDVELSVSGVNETLLSKIATVSPVVNPQTNTFTVQIPVSNESLTLKGGMRTSAIVDLDTIDDAIVIPANAILYQDGEPYTFVVDDLIVRRQVLELGSRDGDLFEVISGVEEEEQVVTTGKERLTDGAEITIRSE
ncbi:efflux RND transporter periplasmic adaptor subunit [Halalkalibacter alkaliphilus]|uniref:Efflux RND transporter periplasmic adaptor subunit n=1 Tax=Halalkalibacter alkaliphilus TaxID=2917993 RepID=A0A9X2I6X8_9BACI|nr:efflux RND transporter periplasmic adaptor subunit [Halalkalibacter alkaliphilus]MCL7749152.1 efflux RND transporter periplasmic adaptor subunit [Halalkalibacter alkaliphilus]